LRGWWFDKLTMNVGSGFFLSWDLWCASWAPCETIESRIHQHFYQSPNKIAVLLRFVHIAIIIKPAEIL
jgi:hypothetical protein